MNFYGANHIQSPNLDKLASQSLVFNRAYCNIPVCGASRASLLTGARPTRNRFIDARTQKDYDYPEAISLPMLLKQNGYTTISNGKIYHHKTDDESAWNEIWQPDVLWNYALPESQEIRKNTKRGLPFEVAQVQDSVYRDGKIALKVIKDLQILKNGKQPFFLTMGLMKPHLPFNAPKKYWDLYDIESIELPESYMQPESTPKQAFHKYGELRQYENIPKKGDIPEDLAKKLIHGYYACVSYIDSLLGDLLSDLDALGLRDNTIIVFWSDHGFKLGEHSLWHKHTNFELDCRVPFMISAPGYRKGKRTGSLVELLDIYPTLCDLAGLPIPKDLEGTSLLPVLENPNHSVRSFARSQYPRGANIMGYAIKTDRYRYVEWTDTRANEIVAKELYDHFIDGQENVNQANNLSYQAEMGLLSDKVSTFNGAH